MVKTEAAFRLSTTERLLMSSNPGIGSFCKANGYVLFVFVLFRLAASPCCASLSFNFYAASCPSAEFMVANTVRSASSFDRTIPGKLLRLLFHDCFVEGCDASVLLQGNGTERSDPANASLGGFEVIDSAKRVLEIFCPGTVSCADIIALAARDSVEIAGGPAIQIPTGRRDGRASAAENGKLTLIDTSLDSSYANELMRKCPANASSSVTVNNDPETSFVFDNQYYRNLLAHKGLFQSDSVLLHDERTRKQVENFANDQESFFSNWGLSFLKVTSIGVKTEDEGEIRQTCSMTNG
ncbi:hypothetical protein WN943_000184 [Citrus x changshan-huyou]